MMPELITITEYAALHGKAASTIRHRIMRGLHPEAVKVGRDWLIPKDAPYRPDGRAKKEPRN